MTRSYAALTRLSIHFQDPKGISKLMDCRVKPGNDDCGPAQLLHVDLESELDFGSRHAAAQAPVFRRRFDPRDLDVERGRAEGGKIADDRLIERSLGGHRAPRKTS